MTLLGVARYQAITGDTTSDEADVDAAITDAVALLEEVLQRPLEEAERTERVYPARDGRIYPVCTPIASVDGDGYVIDGYALTGYGPFGFLAPFGDTPLSVTYVGGYVERDDSLADNALPICIERDLALAAYQLLHTDLSATPVPAGAISLRLGDAGVTFGRPAAAPGSLDNAWSRQTLRYRYRSV